MVLISNVGVSNGLLMAIICEVVIRNVVWMLDKKGANTPELAYMEADEVSMYRSEKTSQASKTSYRLLMFLYLFRQSINRGGKSLDHLLEELFDKHGTPPKDAAKILSGDIKAIQRVNNFPKSLQVMGFPMPSAANFTAFLRRTVEDSAQKGYSAWGISQAQALSLRQQKEPTVVVRPAECQKPEWRSIGGRDTISFFPRSNYGEGASSRDRSHAKVQGSGSRRGR